MKKRYFAFICVFVLLLSLSSISVKVVFAEERLYLGGMPAGFVIRTRGVEVVGVGDVITDNGPKSPAKDADIQVGDVILKIDNTEINSLSDVECAINDAKTIVTLIDRRGERLLKDLIVVKDFSGKSRIGIFIKDSVSGIGTITYIKGDRFASLGHPIINQEGNIIETTGGNVYSCKITGYIKGERGKAGELKGVFVRSNPIFKIEKNIDCGVYGKLINKPKNLEEVKVGQAVPGDAQIVSTICGDKALRYDVSIVKVDQSQNTKNLVLKVNDKKLLDCTGGIVQGMSGSPIIQNGKLVGAVTHVFLNDPTRGFGIDIDNMLKN